MVGPKTGTLDDILAGLNAMDQANEDKILGHLSARFFSIAKRRIGNEEEAKDVTQQACVTVLEKYRTESFEIGFVPWAYGILRMKIGNHFQQREVQRRRIHTDPIILDIAGSNSQDHSGQLRTELIKCLKKILAIKPRYARILNLSYQGYSADEICKKLHIRKNNMYALLSKSRSLLRKCLETGEVS